MKLQLLFVALLATLNLSALTVGEIPKTAIIKGDNGGYVSDGSAWSSTMLKDKVYVVFYVDPDEKDTNTHFSDALKAKEYRKKGAYGSVAIVNLAATWKPNFIIEKLLKSKQEEFPQTIYVKDKHSVLVNEWDLADNASDILIFDKDGTLLFYKAGAMDEEDMQNAFEIIEAHI